MNVANAITLLRILLIPLLVIFLIGGEPRFAFLVFVAAGISDGLDGFVARFFGQKTRLGAYLDPIADKLLLITSYITMAVINDLPAWLAVLVVSRDIIILAGVTILIILDRPVEIRPSYLSKFTTCAQLALIGVYLGRQYLAFLADFELPLILITAVFTVLSGFHYIGIGWRLMGGPEGE